MGQWLQSSWHEVYKIAGVTVLVGERLFHYIVEWEDKAGKVKAFFGRRKGDTEMGALGYIELISKIAAEAPVLLPDAMKLLADLNQFNADFQKLLTDFQSIKTVAAVATPAAPATPPAAA